MFGRPIVDNQGRIELGSRVRLMSEFAPVELRTAPSGRLVIGERTGINYGTSFHVVDSVQIGANVYTLANSARNALRKEFGSA